jgi:hypothetical protein
MRLLREIVNNAIDLSEEFRRTNLDLGSDLHVGNEAPSNSKTWDSFSRCPWDNRSERPVTATALAALDLIPGVYNDLQRVDSFIQPLRLTKCIQILIQIYSDRIADVG